MDELIFTFLGRDLRTASSTARTNCRIIGMHWLRTIRRFLRSPNRIIGSLANPILYLVALGFGLGPTFKQSGQGIYLQFLTPGVIGMIILFSGAFSGTDLLMDRRWGLMRQVLVAPVPRLTLAIGWILGASTVALTQGAVVLPLCFIAGFRSTSSTSFLETLLFMSLLALMSTAFGMFAGSLIHDFSAYQTISNFIIFPLFFFSGAVFPLTNAPKAIVIIARCDPVAYAVDGMRIALIGGTTAIGASLDFLFCILGIVCLVAASGYSFSVMRDFDSS